MHARIVAILSGGLLAASAALAGDERDVMGAGENLYRTYCASCHGVDGRGKGPVAPSLATQPADLTLLARKFGRPLPVEVIAEFIDGREDVGAHGPREMPVWGEIFFQDLQLGSSTAEKAKRTTVLMIIRFLDSLQTIQQSKR